MDSCAVNTNLFLKAEVGLPYSAMNFFFYYFLILSVLVTRAVCTSQYLAWFLSCTILVTAVRKMNVSNC